MVSLRRLELQPLLSRWFAKTIWECKSEASATPCMIRDFKKLIVAQTGTRWSKITLKKWYMVFKNDVSLRDYEIHDRMNLEVQCQ